MASGTLTNLGDTVPAVVTQPMMTIATSGTYTGGTVAFELSSPDGSTWSGSYAYPVEGGPALSSVALTANQARSFLMPCGVSGECRVRAVTAMGGNCAVSITAAAAGGGGGASENHLGEVGGRRTAAAATITRPASVTAYAAKQVVGGATAGASIMTFANLLRSTAAPGNAGDLVKARLRTDQSTFAVALRLWLFYVNNPAANTADQTAYKEMFADRVNTAGWIDFPTATTEDATSDSAGSIIVPGVSNLPLSLVQPGADQNLYGILEALAPFTPVSGQNFWVSLHVDNY